MPATAGRVRMPANNRVHSSAALQTHGIWQSAIGYDPYAPTNKEESKNSQKSADPENAYASFQGLLALARITGSNNNEARGACKRCGRVGHLTFQCRNFLSVKEDKEKDPEAIEAAVMSGLEKIKSSFGKGEAKKAEESSEEEEEEESESSDSEVDSEIERIIAERYGKKVCSKGKSSLRKKKKRDANSDEDESDSGSGDRKRRQRSKKRTVHKRRASTDSEDEDESRRKRRKERRRRKRDDDESDSSDVDEDRRHRRRKSRKEKRRRRSRRYSDDFGSDASEDSSDRRQKRRSKVAASSDSDASVSGDDYSRAGRGSSKRSEKKSRKHRDRQDE